ncbi:hypothetical protein R1flu_020583 [Riccia fluitans]|uniref:CRAL-TRIO domain-containing protein n=1 Tax=Riccia fluitans TaxID=41844 RepID=A0ABD1ZLX4_9MARC
MQPSGRKKSLAFGFPSHVTSELISFQTRQNPRSENRRLKLAVMAVTEEESGKAEMEGAQAASSAAFRYADEDFSDLEELQVLRLEGVDKQGRKIIRIVGKFLPATAITRERLKVYITNKLTGEVKDSACCIVYFHSRVDRGENSPGMLYMRQIYEDLPLALRQQLGAIYVVHPGLKSRLILATFGRFFLSEGFYQKVVYISRVEFLLDYMKKGQVEVPEFVKEHDDDLENRPLMDYGLESADPRGVVDGSGSRVWSRQPYY